MSADKYRYMCGACGTCVNGLAEWQGAAMPPGWRAILASAAELLDRTADEIEQLAGMVENLTMSANHERAARRAGEAEIRWLRAEIERLKRSCGEAMP